MSITVEGARAAYGRTLRDRVTMRRLQGVGAAQVKFDAEDLRARIAGYGPDELIGPILQGDRRVILLAEDLEERQWPAPPRSGDRCIVGDVTMTVISVDGHTRKVGETLIAYEIQVRG